MDSFPPLPPEWGVFPQRDAIFRWFPQRGGEEGNLVAESIILIFLTCLLPGFPIESQKFLGGTTLRFPKFFFPIFLKPDKKRGVNLTSFPCKWRITYAVLHKKDTEQLPDF